MSPYPASDAQALAAEVAKCLKLVAPAGMNAEQQTVWLHAAVDALEDIRPAEVAAISPELRRSVTRPAQIVPEIARLVGEKRSRANRMAASSEPSSPELSINREAQHRRAMARGRDEINAAWAWERSERATAGLAVQPLAPPLNRDELDKLSPQMRSLGLTHGHLTYRDGQLVEAA